MSSTTPPYQEFTLHSIVLCKLPSQLIKSCKVCVLQFAVVASLILVKLFHLNCAKSGMGSKSLHSHSCTLLITLAINGFINAACLNKS